MAQSSWKRTTLFLIAGIIILGVVAVLSVLFGSTSISWHQIQNAIVAYNPHNNEQIVIRELRIPRTIGCILVGAAFSTAGALMQGVTRNPLADSGLLGINSGASFALALCMAFLSGISFSGYVLISFLGAAVATMLVYGLMSMNHRKIDPVRLVLAGSAVSIFLSSLAQGIAIFYNIGQDLTFWTAGGVGGIRAHQLIYAAPVIVVALLISIILSNKVAILSLGDDVAKGLGLNIERTRTACLFIVMLLAGSSVALAGPIAFVGLLVPHITKFFVGGNYRSIIPCSMVSGAVFMILADILSRIINAPSETPIGLVFSIIGVPFFIWTARREERSFD